MKRIIRAILYPLVKSELEYRRHVRSTKLQNELNREHIERFGWYVANHEYVRVVR